MKQHFYILWGVCGISLCLIATTGTVQAQSIQIDGTTPTTPDSQTIDPVLKKPKNSLPQKGEPVIIASADPTQPSTPGPTKPPTPPVPE
uniref:Uncharacterized protein n=1 Tax=Desmonostoc muscorum LEGE 12446 TaxID=1828758 RepID=A0A8J7D0P1_DESMC